MKKANFTDLSGYSFLENYNKTAPQTPRKPPGPQIWNFPGFHLRKSACTDSAGHVERDLIYKSGSQDILYILCMLYILCIRHLMYIGTQKLYTYSVLGVRGCASEPCMCIRSFWVPST